jgi:CRP/FNR family transcriptional regulator, cyclic AMP receptor protein
MQGVQIDSLTQLIGYVASGLVLTTFCFSNPIRLRIFALASNIAFIAYGCYGQIYPVMVLHIVLVPINLFHLASLLQISDRMAMLLTRCRSMNRRLA